MVEECRDQKLNMSSVLVKKKLENRNRKYDSHIITIKGECKKSKQEQEKNYKVKDGKQKS